MSVVLSCNYLVVRKSAVEELYPGGLVAFRKEWMPTSPADEYEDPYLLSFMSMGGGIAPLATRLFECGFAQGDPLKSPNVFYGTEVRGKGHGCDWLEFGHQGGFLICWLKGKPRGKLAYAYLR
jgi:hypothetical protein